MPLLARATLVSRVWLSFYGLLAGVAGFLLFVLARETGEWFSWTIQPPLTAAFLGAAYFAALVLFVATVREGSSSAARAALVPTVVIAGGLLWATLLHADRFHDDLFGSFWRVAYVLAVPLTAAMLVLELRRSGRLERRGSRMPGALRAGLVLQGLVLGGVGVVLFADPASAGSLWPWELTPLTARAVAAFLAGFAAAALHAALVDDARRFAPGALAYATLGALELVALVLFAGDVTGSAAQQVAYVAGALVVLATGAWGCLLARAQAMPRAALASSGS